MHNLTEISVLFRDIQSRESDLGTALALTHLEDLPEKGYNYWHTLGQFHNELDTLLKKYEAYVDEYMHNSADPKIDEFKRLVSEQPINTKFKRGIV